MARGALGRYQPTYEELKQGKSGDPVAYCGSYQPTYEELKPIASAPDSGHQHQCYQPTYEELKPYGQQLVCQRSYLLPAYL